MEASKNPSPPAHIELASDSSVLVTFQGTSLAETNRRVLQFFEYLQKEAHRWPFLSFHPAYQSLLIDFDPEEGHPIAMLKDLERLLRSFDFSSQNPGEVIQIPVQYGGEFGPDLAEVAEHTGLSLDEVIQLHSSAEYTVAFLGFAPGFPYLLGLPEKLRCPRKKTPRLKVPAGGVALAGLQTGIYPTESPGGWQVIGQTDQYLFDPRREHPSYLKPGDRVLFVPSLKNRNHFQKKFVLENTAEPKSATLKIENPGFFSTVQDRGREGWTHLGVSPGGAADPVALRMGQDILGNSEKAAAIEMTAQGGIFTFLKDSWFAVTGADCSPELDQQKIAMWTSLPVSAGQRLAIGNIQKNLRSYLHIYGGVGVEDILHSGSTLVSAGWGGFQGRALRKGDLLPAGEQIQSSPGYRRCQDKLKSLYASEAGILRVTRGPQQNWFSQKSVEDFFSQEFEVTLEVNRLGLRLSGPSMEYREEWKCQELTSEGVANGAIQVPGGGQPLILFCEQRTTGGYAKIANVIRADWFRLGQIKPGQKIRFVEVDMEEGWKINQEFESLLKESVNEF